MPKLLQPIDEIDMPRETLIIAKYDKLCKRNRFKSVGFRQEVEKDCHEETELHQASTNLREETSNSGKIAYHRSAFSLSPHRQYHNQHLVFKYFVIITVRSEVVGPSLAFNVHARVPIIICSSRTQQQGKQQICRPTSWQERSPHNPARIGQYLFPHLGFPTSTDDW